MTKESDRTADLGYLLPLFGLADSLASRDAGGISFGLGEIEEHSSLGKDDQDTEGYQVSAVVQHAIGAALDHTLTLSALVQKAQVVTTAAPWTLTRAIVEPAAVAVWVLDGSSRSIRRERALRVWHHDMTERGKWENNVRYQPDGPKARLGSERANQMISIGRSLGLREPQIATPLNYGDVVAEGGAAVGWKRNQAMARWREAAAFAHGRTWPTLRNATPVAAERTGAGFSVAMTFAEAEHHELARLATELLTRAIDVYARAAAGPAR